MCWGSNTFGQTGSWSCSSAQPTPGPVALAGAFQVGGGWEHTCAATDAGVYCWGADDYGKYGNGTCPVRPPTNVQETAPALRPPASATPLRGPLDDRM